MRNYRGKTKDGKWVFGSLLFFSGPSLTYIVETQSCISLRKCDYNYSESEWHIDKADVFEVIPATVGQSTGLKDKNGVEIFKGDIMRYTDLYLEEQDQHDLPVSYLLRFYYEVVYYGGCFSQRRLDTKPEDMPEDSTENIYYDWHKMEVIGNTTDTPELLEGK